MEKYDVMVIGAGHAGIEAALASSRMGCRTLVVTLRKDAIGLMSCNPAIGGVGKAQLVKEIDALGGEMAKAADACGIQFRILNASKGAAVQSLRAQIDMDKYKGYMRDLFGKEKNLSIKEAEVKQLIVEDNCVKGVRTDKNEEILSICVIIAAGTFLDGVIHIGLKHFSAGRINEQASVGLGDNLKALGLELLRFKTGTCPRLDKKTTDFSRLKIQEGDNPAMPFSFSTEKVRQKQTPCYITYTNENTHKIILDNLDHSPLYSGIIKSTGVRYCPSIEDKIVKFKDRQRHQVFLEPESLDRDEVYLNGLSTSLPKDVQLKMIRSVEGLEDAKIIRFGYGIEHSIVQPTQLYPTLETKIISNLFLAGQINGTTGYEEAAAQGLISGINACLRVREKELLILDRASSYIGVLIDDLTTKGTNEPYRMFTSRVEYRLILRQDNADLRLSKIGYDLGLLSEDTYNKVENKKKDIAELMKLLKVKVIKPSPRVNSILIGLGTEPIKKTLSLEQVLKRPQVNFSLLKDMAEWENNFSEAVLQQVEIEVKYAGFMSRQFVEVEKFKNIEKIKLSPNLDYECISGLSREIKEKLTRFKPVNLGQACRISGVTPAAVSILMVYLKKLSAGGGSAFGGKMQNGENNHTRTVR